MTSASLLDEGSLDSNLMILGGPDNNEISMRFISEVYLTFQCGNPPRYEIRSQTHFVMFATSQHSTLAQTAFRGITDLS